MIQAVKKESQMIDILIDNGQRVVDREVAVVPRVGESVWINGSSFHVVEVCHYIEEVHEILVKTAAVECCSCEEPGHEEC